MMHATVTGVPSRKGILQTILLSGALLCAFGSGSASQAATAGTAQQSCTAQWREHGHTTQAEAKAFARKCLKEQGAVAQQLNISSVTKKLTTLLDAGKPLTELVPSDIATFCPGYNQQPREGRAVFWRTVLAVITGPESAYNTATAYWEKDQHQYSLGLLQLSFADEAIYKCGFKSEVDVTKPDLNLSCGIKIMTKLVGKAGIIGGDTSHTNKGGGAYWSTLRHTSDARDKVITATKALPQCKP